MTYSEKLRDPRWQKLRLKVLERDEFACRHCTDEKSELQVHHKNYRKGYEPWDYPADSLITLCRRCHESVEEVRRSLFDNVHDVVLFKCLEHLNLILLSGDPEKLSCAAFVLDQMHEHPDLCNGFGLLAKHSFFLSFKCSNLQDDLDECSPKSSVPSTTPA
jgi:hypothetical protein